VLAALNHEEPDRCPCQVSFTPEFADRLREDLSLRGGLPHNPHGGGNRYELERALGQDMLLTSVGWANSYYQARHPYTDEWGVRWKPSEYTTPFGTGCYTEFAGHPLADPGAIPSYTPPDPTRPELYDEARRVVTAFGEEYWIVGVTVTTIFETAWALRGLDALLMDLIEEPERAEAVLDIPFHYHLTAARKLLELGVDMIWVGDDVGMQTGMMIAPATWRKFLKPRMAEFIATLRSVKPDVVIAYHSDGDISAIVADLVEIGVDVLNPIQPACMDPAGLKRAYGDKLCFWGSIDEQHTLPFGSPDDVAREVRTRLQTLGKGGGLIVGPTHHVQLDTPLENFWAMMRAILDTPYSSSRDVDQGKGLKKG